MCRSPPVVGQPLAAHRLVVEGRGRLVVRDRDRRRGVVGPGRRVVDRDRPGRALPVVGALALGAVRAAVREVLESPDYARNARDMARRLAAAPGPTRSAELLEELAASTAPISTS